MPEKKPYDLSHQDWEPVILQKTKKPVISGEKKTAIHHAKTMSKLEHEDFVPDKPVTSYGKFLQQARLTKKFNQKSIASKLGVSAKTVQLWECGKEIIPGNKIAAINRLLNVNVKKGTYN
jgi:DNA-binding transcriptional regulator YiaG